jgi:hypothetical protein
MTISSLRGISRVSWARKNINPPMDTPQNNSNAISLEMRKSDTQVKTSEKLMSAGNGSA